MDMSAVASGIGSDVAGVARAFGPVGWVLLALVFLLPVTSLLVALRGSKLAMVPLLGSVALLAAWVLYYALARWRLEAGAIIPFFGLVLVGWLVLVVAIAEERSKAT